MLRRPQHERKILNDIKTPPFVTSINSVQALRVVEGLAQGFSAATQFRQIKCFWMPAFAGMTVGRPDFFCEFLRQDTVDREGCVWKVCR
jgi:hypothetical protein